MVCYVINIGLPYQLCFQVKFWSVIPENINPQKRQIAQSINELMKSKKSMIRNKFPAIVLFHVNNRKASPKKRNLARKYENNLESRKEE